MGDTAIDVLVFLFDHYFDAEIAWPLEEAGLERELTQAGFPETEIKKAFNWLGDLADLHLYYGEFEQAVSGAQRILTSKEQQKLGCLSHGFLRYLENTGFLDPVAREIILDRAMAIEGQTLTLEQFKKIVGLVLLNCAETASHAIWLAELIYDDVDEMIVH